MKKIAVFKTIRTTSMGHLINEIKNKFSNCKITVISASKNSMINSLFDDVNIIYLDFEPINLNKTNKNILLKIKKESFDIGIIPTEGNLLTYDNVLNFANYFLIKTNIFYYIYPNSFINYTKIKKNIVIHHIIKMLSFICSIPIFFLMIIILIGKSIFNFFRFHR